MTFIKPLKKYGQNFLVDQNIINKIIAELNVDEKDPLLEIGPGNGALTEHLVEINKNFTAVELDKRACTVLLQKYPDLNLVNADIQKFDLNNLYKSNRKLRIIGNIPYNITRPILLKILHNSRIIRDVVLMVQYEVAQKITASKKDPDYGIISVLMKYFTRTEICFKVPNTVFLPKPKVDSAIIHIYLKNDEEFEPEVDKYLFIQIVNASFNNRRKTLKNSLSNSIFSGYDFSGCKVDLKKRAEELEINDFILLTRFVNEQRKPGRK